MSNQKKITKATIKAMVRKGAGAWRIFDGGTDDDCRDYAATNGIRLDAEQACGRIRLVDGATATGGVKAYDYRGSVFFGSEAEHAAFLLAEAAEQAEYNANAKQRAARMAAACLASALALTAKPAPRAPVASPFALDINRI